MTVYTTKTIIATITGTNGDFVAALDSYNIGNDGEHLKTKFDIVLPTAWNVFIATTPASFISVEYRNAKGRCGRSANIAVPASIATHIFYEVPRDALYAPETEFWFTVYQDIDGTESRITKTAIVKCNVAEGHKSGTVPDPFGHDIIQQVRGEFATADLLKLDKNFTTSTSESALLATDIIPINKVAGTLKKSTLQVLSAWLGETITHAFTTSAQTIKGAINELKADLTNLSFTGSTHDALVTGALIDIEGVDFGVGGLATYLDGRLDKWEVKQPKWINVKSFGALGNDVDDTAALIACVAATVNNTAIYIPGGTFVTSQRLLFEGLTNIKIMGDGTIKLKAGADNVKPLVFNNCINVEVKDISIDGNRANQTKVSTGNGKDVSENCPAILFENVENGSIHNVKIINQQGDGIELDVLVYTQLDTTGRECKNIQIYDCVIDTVGRNGISIVHADGVDCYNNIIKNADLYTSTLACGIDVEPNPGYNFMAKNLNIHDNIFEDCASCGIQIYKPANLTDVSNITVSNNNALRCGVGYFILGCNIIGQNINFLNSNTNSCNTGIAFDDSSYFSIKGGILQECLKLDASSGFGIKGNSNYQTLTANYVDIIDVLINGCDDNGCYLINTNNSLISVTVIDDSRDLLSDKASIRFLSDCADNKITKCVTKTTGSAPLYVTQLFGTMGLFEIANNAFFNNSDIGVVSASATIKQSNNYYDNDLLDGSATWNPGSLADGVGETSAAITISGAALGDFVLVSAPYDLQGITCNGYVSATAAVKIHLQNETTGTIDLASGTWKVKVIK